MATVTISCPHCGLAKEVEKERVPAGSVRITCPQCRGSFVFGTPPDPPISPETLTIVCHHCGLTKDVPIGTIPEGTKVTCPRCRNSFLFGKAGEGTQRTSMRSTGETPPPSGAGTPEMATPPPSPDPPGTIPTRPGKRTLSGIGALFSMTWTMYKRRVKTLLGLNVFVLIPLLILCGAVYTIHWLFPDLRTVTPLLAAMAIAGLVAAVFTSLWGKVAIVFAVVDESLTIREALGRGWQRLHSFLWLFFLTTVIFMGGTWLFFIPGVLFLVWFFCGQFVLAGEDERGMNALLKSKEYVKGYFFGVILRLFVVFLIWVAISLVPLVGPLLSAFFMPIAMTFAFLVYRDLRDIKGDVSFPSSLGEKLKWAGVVFLGYAVVPIVTVAFLGTALLTMFSFEKARFMPPGNYFKAVATASPGKAPDLPPLLKMAAKGKDVTPVSTTAAEYDALLASRKVDFDGGTKASVGPAAFLLDTFWDDAKSPHVWLKVRVAPLPNLELGGKFAQVTVEHVWNRENRDIYNSASPFETEFFQRLSFPRQDVSAPYYEGIRDVHLQAGATEKDLSGIEGTLVFKLPEKIETTTFDPSMIGKEVSCAGTRFFLKEMAGNKLTLEYRGDPSLFIKAVGYNGKEIVPLSMTYTSKVRDVTSLKPEFNGDVSSVKIIVATALVERRYPFALKR